jgi:hypothetical protein
MFFYNIRRAAKCPEGVHPYARLNILALLVTVRIEFIARLGVIESMSYNMAHF